MRMIDHAILIDLIGKVGSQVNLVFGVKAV